VAHITLLEDLQVRRWYDNVSRASELTAEVNLRRLGLFCNRLHLTPLGLLEKEPQEIHSLLVDTVTELEKKGYAGSYLQGIVKGVKSRVVAIARFVDLADVPSDDGWLDGFGELAERLRLYENL